MAQERGTGQAVGLETDKRRLAELTAEEARTVFARRPVVLLPLGSHEDQGPHAPMGDHLAAGAIADRVAARATARGVETYVAPTLPFGGGNFFATTVGGIALSQTTMRAVLEDIFTSLVDQGIDRLIVLNGHGGNVEPVNDVTRTLYRRRKVLVPSLYLWRIGYALLPEILGPETAKRASGHGADPLTSVYWHLFPDLVRPDLVPEPIAPGRVLDLPMAGFGTVSFEGAEVSVPVAVDEISPNAVLHGDARLSSPETGAALVDRLVERVTRFTVHFAGRVP